MQLSVKQSDFSLALKSLSRIVPARNTLPVLSSCLLEAEGERLRLMAMDLETSLELSIPAEVGEGGKCCLPAKKLSDLVAAMSAAEVNLSLVGARVTLKAGSGKYTLPSHDPEDFPSPLAVEGVELQVAAGKLRDLITLTSYAAAPEDGHNAISGLQVTLAGGSLRLAATDGHRLSVAEADVESEVELASIIPAKAMEEILRLVPLSKDTVSVTLSEQGIRVVCGDTIFAARALEGPYPEWDYVVPRDSQHTLTADQAALLSGLQRVILVSEDKFRVVNMEVDEFGDILTLKAISPESGEAEERIDCTWNGTTPYVIHFNARYLIETLRSLSGQEVAFYLLKPTDAVVIREVGRDGWFSVVMPIRHHQP